MDDWIHVETGGYLRYTTENRNWFETDFPAFLQEARKHLSDYERTDEHASHILEALETGRTYRGHFNVKNGCIIKTYLTIASSKTPVLLIVSVSMWLKVSRFQMPERPPAAYRCQCSGWARKPRFPEMLTC